MADIETCPPRTRTRRWLLWAVRLLLAAGGCGATAALTKYTQPELLLPDWVHTLFIASVAVLFAALLSATFRTVRTPALVVAAVALVAPHSVVALFMIATPQDLVGYSTRRLRIDSVDEAVAEGVLRVLVGAVFLAGVLVTVWPTRSDSRLARLTGGGAGEERDPRAGGYWETVQERTRSRAAARRARARRK